VGQLLSALFRTRLEHRRAARPRQQALWQPFYVTMALTLVVLTGSAGIPARLTLDSPRIVVGRASNSELRLPDYSVSLRHASFRQRGTEYLILDEGSTNGTFVGPVKLAPQAPRVVRSGDRIRFGRIWVEVLVESIPASPNAALVAREFALRLVANALTAAGESTSAQLVIQDGADRGTELVLKEPDRRYVIGRAGNCDVVLNETNASRRHLEVSLRSGQVYVRDLGSKNGTVLAGLPLPARRESLWPPNAEMRIGSNRVLLVDPVASALEELENGADDVLAPDEEVPVPAEESGGDTSAAPSDAAPRRTTQKARTESPSHDVGSLTEFDLLIAVLALLLLGASLFGLIWLLGGY
jgi:pSer/pThr/pTyr-binding forkhead associated (FHA) protein